MSRLQFTSAPHEARDHAARLIRAVAAPEALGHHCNCRDELPNFARELAGEPNAEAGDWWKREQEGEHRTRRAAKLVRPAAVLGVHLPKPRSRNRPGPPQRECRPRGRGGWELGSTSHCVVSKG